VALMRNEDDRAVLTLLSTFAESDASRTFEESLLGSSTWRGRIPVAAVDVLLPLFGATAPAPLLPERPVAREFFEPMAGLAMREIFETGVFPNLFGALARPETLAFSRDR
jgi:hypothetical protein